MTNLYYEPKQGRKGSKVKQQESHRAAWLESLTNSYYEVSDAPIWVQMLLPTPYSYQGIANVILEKLCICKDLDVLERKQLEIESKSGMIKLFISPLPHEDRFMNYSGWSIIGEGFGIVTSVTDEHILNVIDKKISKIESYRCNCDEVWLLIVADGSWQSGMLRYNGLELSLDNKGFNEIWLLEYLDSVHQLKG